MNSSDLPSHETAVANQKQQAATAAIQQIVEAQGVIETGRQAVKDNLVAATNAMWRQGMAIMEMVGCGQLTFAYFQKIQAALPAGVMDFETARRRVSLTCKLSQPVASWDELANDLQKEVQRQLEMAPVLATTEGDEKKSRLSDPFTVFLKEITLMKQAALKATRNLPLAEMSEERLTDFLSDTQWVVEMREQAAELLAQPEHFSRR